MTSLGSCRLDDLDYCSNYGKGRFSPHSRRESMQMKLEEYREQQEELELRALTAEMETGHLQLKVENLERHVTDYKKNVAALNTRVDTLQSANDSGEKNLQQFHHKLSRIRTSITNEVDKMKKNEGDLQLAYDSVMRCVQEFRNNLISKTDFLTAVNLINSTFIDKPPVNSPESIKTMSSSTAFASTLTERLSLLSPNGRLPRLQSLMSMLSEQGMCGSTDDELLDGNDQDQITPSGAAREECEKPPPIPPRSKSASFLLSQEKKTSQDDLIQPTRPVRQSLNPIKQSPSRLQRISESSLDFLSSLSTNVSSSSNMWNSTESSAVLQPSHSSITSSSHTPPPPPAPAPLSPSHSSKELEKSPAAKFPHERPLPYSTQYSRVGQADSDSDYSDDFEQFVPPKRYRYSSEPFPQQRVLEHVRDRRASSPLPESNKDLKKSSPILTKRPGWYSKPEGPMRKYKSEVCFSPTIPIEKTGSSGSVTSRKLKYRSKSLNVKAVTPRQSIGSAVKCFYDVSAPGLGYESDDTTGGTIESKDYSKPFEHVLWKRLGLEDGSAISGSLPHLNRFGCMAFSDTEDMDDGCTYLDPKELEEYCERLGNKELSDRIRTRLSTVLSGTYLSLTNVQTGRLQDGATDSTVRKIDRNVGGVRADADSVSKFELDLSKRALDRNELEPESPPPQAVAVGDFLARPYSPLHTTNSLKRNALGDSISYSGYSTDASSGFGEADYETDTIGMLGRLGRKGTVNKYSELVKTSQARKAACSNGAVGAGTDTRTAGEEEEEEEETDNEKIYEEIDHFSDTDPRFSRGRSQRLDPFPSDTQNHNPGQHSRLQLSHSVPNKEFFAWHRRRPNGREDLDSCDIETPYATLKDVSAQPRGFKRAPTLPPRRVVKKTASLNPSQGQRKHYNKNDTKIPGIGPLPKYMTLKSDEQHLQLVPLSNESPNHSQSEFVAGENEPNNHLYSLGQFMHTGLHGRRLIVQSHSGNLPCSAMSLPPRRTTVATAGAASTLASPLKGARGSGSGSDVTSPPPEGMEHRSSATLPPRSHTVTLPYQKSKLTTEKSGYLKKMDFRLKNWNRRWFVLSGTELKYYKPNRKALKGVINLDSWCKLVKGQTSESFQLVTPKKTYYLVCKSDQECNEWLQAVGAAMHVHKIQMSQDPLKLKKNSITGWAHVSHKGQSKKVWCTLNGPNLDICEEPQAEPIRRISVAQSSVRKKRDSILLDSSGSHSNLRSMLFTIRDSTGVTEISPEIQEDKDSWYYHLSAIQCGEQNLQLTKTEKLISEIMMGESSSNPIDHPHWKHPVLNHLLGPLQSPLTSLPSTSLNVAAKKLFQSTRHFMTTKLTRSDLTFHIHTVQYIMNACLKHCPLQDELYCQLLRQLSGNTNHFSTQVMQGWLLLSIMVSTFLPIKPKFMWYLQTFLNRHFLTHDATISSFARFCQECVTSAQEHGLRQCKPSNIELVYVLGNFADKATLDHTLVVPVYLTDGSSPDINFTPFTTIRDLTSKINEKIGMPETCQTGFAIMCDWPGMDDSTCCCPIPESKVVDVMSTWSAALAELSGQIALDRDTIRIIKSQRNILFTYKRRLFVQAHNGLETDREALLLAYQISRSVHSGEYPLLAMDKAATMAAKMTQIEHGDWSCIESGRTHKEAGRGFDETAHEAMLQFCPWSLTHMALDHSLNLLQRKLVENWKMLEGMSQEQCAKEYISIAQQWSNYGCTAFQAEECVTETGPRRSILLSVSERGVALLERVSMKVIHSYTYQEISTFGGNGDEHFMLVISSQDGHTPTGQRGNPSPSQGNVVEKLIFGMPKLKICEATFLIASYIELDALSKT